MGARLQAAEASGNRAKDASARRESPELPGRILALDYGRRRIGLAISDELRITARPLEIIERKNRGDLMRRIRATAREHGARLILVGLPLNLDGTPGEMAEEAARFASRVRKELGVEVELVDERLTSWAADQEALATRRGSGRRGKAKSAAAPTTRDDVAAAIFLRDYLERERPRHESSIHSDAPRRRGKD
jgi:putative holliday junction resolvase